MELREIRLLTEFMRIACDANTKTSERYKDAENNYTQGLSAGMKIANDNVLNYLTRLEDAISKAEEQNPYLKELNNHAFRSF